MRLDPFSSVSSFCFHLHYLSLFFVSWLQVWSIWFPSSFYPFWPAYPPANQQMIGELFTTRTPAFILLDRPVKAVKNERKHTHTRAQTLVWGFPDCYASMKSIMHMRKEIKKLELGKIDETAERCMSGREPHL